MCAFRGFWQLAFFGGMKESTGDINTMLDNFFPTCSYFNEDVLFNQNTTLCVEAVYF